ncbi:hypothetical protein [Aminobacterium colombiense]
MAKNGEMAWLVVNIINEWYMLGRNLNLPLEALNKKQREWMEELGRVLSLPEDETIISLNTFSDKQILDVEEDI